MLQDLNRRHSLPYSGEGYSGISVTDQELKSGRGERMEGLP